MDVLDDSGHIFSRFLGKVREIITGYREHQLPFAGSPPKGKMIHFVGKIRGLIQKIRPVNIVGTRIGLRVQRARCVSYILAKHIFKKNLCHPCQMLMENFTKKPNRLFFCSLLLSV